MLVKQGPVKLSPLEVVLIQKYFELIFYRKLGPVLTKKFYKYLFIARPDLRDIFPHQMSQQNRKLAQSIKMLIEVLPDLDLLDKHFVRLGRAHQGLGLDDEDFRLFAACLIKGLEDLTKEPVIREAQVALIRLCLEVGRRMMSWMPLMPTRKKAA
ncbi:MAG: hypothetical protein JNK21_14680 [Rhodospirillaceae bacterium]|nr:hypothetical protein [Rhodospirillaceae bacterium]